MTQAGYVVEVSPVEPLRGYNGLLPGLRSLGCVDEYASTPDFGEDEATVREEDMDEFGNVRPDLLTKPAHIVNPESGNIGLSRWEAGTIWRPEGYGIVDGWVPCIGAEKTPSPTTPNVTQMPVVFYADDQCSTWGNAPGDRNYNFTERKRRARANLLRHESNEIARELWTGGFAAMEGWDNLSLSQSCERLLPIGTASPLIQGLGTLQANLADALGDGQTGLIHATRETVTAWWAAGALFWHVANGAPGGPPGAGVVPNVTYDIYGNTIIASGGYDGSAPDGSIAEGQPWAYASGPIRAQLGALKYVSPEEMQNIQVDINLETVFIERSAVCVFDQPPLFGLSVDLCCTGCIPSGS